MDNFGELMFAVALVVGYFVPIIVAAARGAKHQTQIALLTLFLGWTFAGWVGALIWATMDPEDPSPDKPKASTYKAPPVVRDANGHRIYPNAKGPCE